MAQSSLEQQVHQDLKEAMKSQDREAANILRVLIAQLNEAVVENDRKDLSAEKVQKEIQRLAKKVQDALDSYQQAGREDLVKQEQAQLKILQKYLPTPLSDKDLEEIVEKVIKEEGATSFADMGKVMPQVMAQVQGRADGQKISQLVREKLSADGD